MDRLAFIAYMRWTRGWSKKNARAEWQKQDQDPDIVTNSKRGELKEVAVMGFNTIKLFDAKTIMNEYAKNHSAVGDDAMAKLNAAIEMGESDSYLRSIAGSAMLEGGSVNVAKQALAYDDNEDEDDAENNAPTKQSSKCNGM